MVGAVVMEWSHSIQGMFTWILRPSPGGSIRFQGENKVQILVTGGAGYIGGHTAKLLARTGYQPIALDSLNTGHRWAVQWGPFVQGDLADLNLLRDVIRAYDIQAVIHF